MAVALVAHTNASGQNGATTSGINTTGANFTRIAICHLTGTFAGTVSDNKGNTYTQAGTTIGAGFANISYYYCASPTVGSGHTATVSASNIFAAVLFAAYSGAAASSPVEATFTSNTANPGTTVSPGSLTPTSNNALLELIGAQNGVPTSVTCGDVLYSTVDIVSGNGTTTITGAVFSYVQTTATASNPSFNADGAAAAIAAVLFAIDAAASGFTGSAAWTEAQDTWAGIGTVLVSGSAAWTEGPDLWAGTGGIFGTGTAAWTEGPDIWAATGTVASGITGSAAWTEGPDLWAGTGTVLVSGAAAWTEGPDIWAGTGLVGVIGSAAWTEGPDIWAGTGTASQPDAIGTAAWTEAPDIWTGTGSNGAVQTGGHFIPLTRKQEQELQKRRRKERKAQEAEWDAKRIDADSIAADMRSQLLPAKTIAEVVNEVTANDDDDDDDLITLLLNS